MPGGTASSTEAGKFVGCLKNGGSTCITATGCCKHGGGQKSEDEGAQKTLALFTKISGLMWRQTANPGHSSDVT